MKLSILILTHNRPELFKRCFKSAMNDYNFEILVNNDNQDIEEIQGGKYFYEKSDNLADLYKFLFNKAKGEYVIFLEDDDYFTDDFFHLLDFEYDVNYFNYMSYDIRKTVKRAQQKFEIESKNINFQLSQIMFKKSLVSEFPTNNDLDNDWNLFQHIKTKTNSIKIVKDYAFIQTTDGKDNISFEKYNKDRRWNILNKPE